jgi:hypothetical protein
VRIKVHVELITDSGDSTTIEACEFGRPLKEFGADSVGLCRSMRARSCCRSSNSTS